MLFERNLRAVSTNDISEKAAWDKVCLWLESRGFTLSAKQYPEGKNNFPDFRAWIDGWELDVEMTSVPDMTDWTLKGTFRKLEERISEIAKQPGQTRSEVIAEFIRKCSDKRHRLESTAQVDDNLYIHNQTDLLQDMRAEQPLYEASRIDIVVDQDVFADVDFVSMNPGVGFGRLQKLDPDERPLPHDIVIYEALPNDLPRVAGIITTVHQTPLSHVNLRSIQNDLPNAYIRDATDNTDISELVGDYVRYEVTGDEWKLRAATNAEADAHYEALRPATTQTPKRDLSVTTITRAHRRQLR